MERIERICTSIAVIGGGPAGVCAALAAARRGAPTVLVTNRPVLGGNSSSEIRVWSRGSVGAGNLYGEEMGIWGGLKLENLYANPDGNPVFWDEVLLDAVLKQDNLRLLLNTEISDLTMQENKILRVEGWQQGTEKRIVVEAEQFIDATGDAVLCEKAGQPYYVGEERVDPKMHGRPLTHEVLCSSLLFYTRKEDHKVPFIPPSYAYSMEKIASLVGNGGRILSESMSGSDCWWFEYGGDRDTIADSQEITIELKKLVMGIWNYIKNSGSYPADNYTLEWVGSIPGKRESRRAETAYMLTEQDIRTNARFDDCAFFGGWYLDMHPSGGIQESEKENCVQTPVTVYQIPLRCLYTDTIANLSFAGRNIGMERGVFASSRVMNTCGLSGQAAGELAAMAWEQHCSLQGLSGAQIREIQLRLLREDMFLPGADIRDPEDLVQKATLTASSWESGAACWEDGIFSLKQGGFVTFPGVEKNTLQLTVDCQRQTVLTGHWFFADLPNRLLYGASEITQSWTVQPGKQVVQFQIPADGDGKFCTLNWEPNDAVSIVLSKKSREGFVCGRKDSPDYLEPMLSYTHDQGLYHPQNAANPFARPWGRPNLWQAAREDMAPWLQAQWDQKQTISQIRLFLDPSLNEELPSSHAASWQESHHFAARIGMPKHLAQAFRVQVRKEDGTWQTISTVQDNCQRLIVINLPQTKTDAIRLCIDSTWGSAPGVYGLRAYLCRK